MEEAKIVVRSGSGAAGFVMLLLSGWAAAADNNAWINPGSGDWEAATNWSGGLPNSNWDTVITNSGWKAVSIGANTANYFPGTMTVKSVTVTSPPDSYNVLLLNYAGYAVPFTANEILDEQRPVDHPGLDRSSERRKGEPDSFWRERTHTAAAQSN